ncbi:hypothetical protein BO443_50429 [Burkholderia orbicola]
MEAIPHTLSAAPSERALAGKNY